MFKFKKIRELEKRIEALAEANRLLEQKLERQLEALREENILQYIGPEKTSYTSWGYGVTRRIHPVTTRAALNLVLRHLKLELRYIPENPAAERLERVTAK